MLSINDVEINIDWELGEACVLYEEEEFIFLIYEGDVDILGDQAIEVTWLEKSISGSFNILDSGHPYMSIEEKEEKIKQIIVGLLDEHYESIE